MVNKIALLPFFCVIVPLIFYIFFLQLQYWSTVTIPSTALGTIVTVTETSTPSNDSLSNGPLVFVGDVLLARNVEFLMKNLGVQYPFKNLVDLFGTDNSAVFGNFESAVLERHKTTPSFNTTFSVDKAYLPLLRAAGFSHMSLANNHSFDYGSTTFNHTILALEQTGLIPFGNPKKIEGISSVITKTGSTRVGIVAVNRIFNTSNWDELKNSLLTLASTTDFQIIYIHWGDEYMLKHSQEQEELAIKLIDAGADAIIGHHPHVVQDITVYKDRPIFYSLGNFIFDQYFSADVKQGLLLKLLFSNNEVQYELVPVTSANSNSQPARMKADERSLFLVNLARRSSLEYQENIKSGKLILPFSLATYP